MTTGTLGILLNDANGASLAHRKNWDTFDERFLRCHKALHFIACRILADSEMAANAVRNCRLKACQNPPDFESTGAFGSWILRLLIGEALSILYSVDTGAKDSQEVRQQFTTNETKGGVRE